MLPTEEEKNRIIEAQMANTDVPLGNAEQFLLTLASVVELEARLKLWLFKLDFDNVELVRLREGKKVSTIITILLFFFRKSLNL
jgi:hypothetical protein